MELKMIILFFLISFSFNSEFYIYQPHEVISFFKKTPISQQKCESIKNSFSKILHEYYAFYEIAKSPPQPDFDPNYHNIVDLNEELNQLNTKNRDFYSFYQDLNKIIAKTKDFHFSFDYDNIQEYLMMFNYTFPIALILLQDEGKEYIYGIDYIEDENIKKEFRNSDKIFDIIKTNEDIPIKSINGKNPFDFISDLGNDYKNLRSPHANFFLKFHFLPDLFLFINPFSLEELTNLTVIYENGNSFTTDYLIRSYINIYENNSDNLLEKNDGINFKKYSLYNLNKYKNNIKKISNIKRKKDIKNKYNLRKLNETENDTIKWDYEFEDIFKCRVDKENEINVYYINSFMGNNISLFVTNIRECVDLFDTNDYPVTLISDFNGGGYALISHLLLELVSPLINVKLYSAIRNTDNFAEIFKEYNSFIFNAETCESTTAEVLLKNGQNVNYGNRIKDFISQPFNLYDKNHRKNIEKIKLKIKNKRKPTDIIIIADGFSYSATSLFLKYLQYYGGGITVGIFGHPGKKNIPFDSSLSPSAIIENDTLYEVSEDYRKLRDNYNFTLQMALIQSFYTPYNISIPLEYVITPVDESQPFYEFFFDETYQDFIEVAKDIHKKYKTECNPKNKKLVKVSSECDKHFNNDYTHGGYECGDDGKWSNKCVASYCDLGYMFDYNENKCVKDFCSDLGKEEEDDDDDDGVSKTELAIIICASILVVLIVIIIIVDLFLNKKKKDSHEELLSSISMSIQDREDAKLYQ